MTRLEDLDAGELRSELDEATRLALALLDELLVAIDSGDTAWIGGLAVAAKPAAQRVKRIRTAIRLGIAA